MTDRNAKMTAERIGLLLNDFGFSPVLVCKNLEREHRTLQQSFTRLCIEWLKTCASDEYRYDGRNEMSHEVSKGLLDLAKENNLDLEIPYI